MALTDKLTAIADAIREKGSTSEKLTLEAMVAAINALEVGGGSGGEMPDPIIAEGDCEKLFTSTTWNWVIENYPDRFKFGDVTAASHMFSYNILDNINLDLDFSNTSSAISCLYMFNSSNAKYINRIKNLRTSNMRSMFQGCRYLRYLPQMDGLKIELSSTSQAFSYLLYECYSLRSIDSELLKKFGGNNLTSSNALVFNSFKYNYVLDEANGISPITGTLKSNMFSGCFESCHRLKNITFATQEDGTPYAANWQNQVIDLHDAVGWDDKSESTTEYPTSEGKLKRIVGYNSGITSDKYVNDEATYAALKNDPDWFTNNVYYSRFNHTSAVNMINSLPDASAYLATQTSGTNIIKFRDIAGIDTDGGKIGNLTEEEIAVATAKGWNVVYAV